MAREAGFEVKIQTAEFATTLNMADTGDFEAYVLAWSGRPDPDGNLYSFDVCKQPLNYTGYCDAETDNLIKQSREVLDPAQRKKVFEQVAAKVLKERPIVYLYHRKWLWAYSPKLQGVRNIPDGLLRVTGLKLAP
jgi:peptide/nickel transport system substrate-binding protein